MELKDKLKKDANTDILDTSLSINSRSVITEEALAALNMLGFQKLQAEKAVQKALKDRIDIQSVEDLIKLSLKNL